MSVSDDKVKNCSINLFLPGPISAFLLNLACITQNSEIGDRVTLHRDRCFKVREKKRGLLDILLEQSPCFCYSQSHKDKDKEVEKVKWLCPAHSLHNR